MPCCYFFFFYKNDAVLTRLNSTVTTLTTVLAGWVHVLSHHHRSALDYCNSLQNSVQNLWSSSARVQCGEIVARCWKLGALQYLPGLRLVGMQRAGGKWLVVDLMCRCSRPGRTTPHPYPECMTCLWNCLLTPPQLTLCVCAVRKLCVWRLCQIFRQGCTVRWSCIKKWRYVFVVAIDDLPGVIL